ncbi:MAG: hypothetical protein PHG67_14535 [Bacteroidales bacterium]|nr:hypothetical protein [Bacteroidales bacterium]
MFSGFVNTSTPTPAHTANKAYIATESGTIFGIAGVVKGQILVDDGSGFGAEYLDVPNKIKFVPGKNLFDKTTHIIDGSYVNISSWGVENAPDWGVTDYISVKPNTDYALTNPHYPACLKAFYDINKILISGASGAQFTTPANCAFVRWTLYNSTAKTAFGDGSGVQLEEGETQTTVVPFISTPTYKEEDIYIKKLYSATIIDEGLSDNSVPSRKTVMDEVSALTAVISTKPNLITELSKNLFDTSKIIEGKYINFSTGLLDSEATSAVSGLIPIIAGEIYSIQRGIDMLGNVVRFVAADGTTSLKALNADGSERTNYSTSRNATIKAPVGAAYFQFTCKILGTECGYDSTQFEIGPEFTAYEPYGTRSIVGFDNLPKNLNGLHERVDAIEDNIFINILTIQNSDKIAFYGCSYTESYYAIKNKSWVNKLAQMTDWIVANFGVSGNRITDEVERLRANSNPYHSTVGVKKLNPSIISFANIGNETLYNIANLDMYRQEFFYALQHVKSVGAEMIIGTDHFATGAVETLLYGLAKELGILAAPIGTVGNQVLSNYYPGFWGSGHPATRTNAHTFLEWLYFVSQLPRPKKSVKVFRVRSEYKAGSPSITDLSYDTIQQRIKIFQEINSGEISLKEANGVNGWEYYDRLDENFSGEVVSNEYCKLIANEDVSFTDNALLELIIDKLNPDTLRINIAVDDAPDEIYIADNNAASTIYDEKRTGQAFKVTKSVYDSFALIPIDEAFTSTGTGANVLSYKGRSKGIHLGGYYLFFGSLIDSVSESSGILTRTSNSVTYTYELINITFGRHQFPLFETYEKPWSRFVTQDFTYTDGVATIALTGDFKKLIQYDKVRLLVAKTGSFNISDINATYTGGVEKRQIVNPKFELKSTGEELNSKTGFDADWLTTGGWTNNGASLKQMPVDVRDYPPIHSDNNHIELGYDDTDGFSTSIAKTFTITPKTKGVTKVVVRAIARLFPKIFDTTETPDDYHTNIRQIKADSFDMGTLVCKLNNGGTPSAILKKPVDIGWSEIYFETYIPATSVTDLTIELYRDEADKIDEVNYRNHLYPMQVYDVSVQVID